MTEELMKHKIIEQLLLDISQEREIKHRQMAIDMYHRFIEACSIAAATKRDEKN